MLWFPSVFFLALVIADTGITVIRFDIPFEYLLTREVVRTANAVTLFNVTDLLVDNCQEEMCFVAFYRNRTKIQVFRNIPSTCTRYPNCVGYGKADYDTSLVLVNTNSSDGCASLDVIKQQLSLDTILPTCPTGWSSYRRTNGMLWCYMTLVNNLVSSYATASEYCGNFNSSLNGFETIQERNAFIVEIRQKTYKSQYMYIGATRDCPSAGCLTTTPFKWQSGVSSNNTLANDIFYMSWLGTGSCLAYLINMELYDDISCKQVCTLSCGKYADVFK